METSYHKPLVKFDFVHQVIQKMAWLCGLDIYDEHYRFTAYGQSFAGLIFVSVLCIAYTRNKMRAKQNTMILIGPPCTTWTYDVDTKFKAISMLGLSVQGIAKVSTFMYYNKTIRKSVHTMRSIFVVNMGRGATPAYAILMDCANRTILVGKVLMSTVGVMCLGFVAYPVVWYRLTGEKEPVMPIYLPVDEDTKLGFAVTTTVHLTWVVQTLIGLPAADILMILCTISIIPMVELFESDFETLNVALRENPQIGSSTEVRLCVRNLSKMHQEICSYISEISQVYSLACGIDVYSNGAALCFLIFCIMVMDYIPHYLMFVTFFVKLLAMCLLGTVIEISTDKILTVIQSGRWYLLPVPLQRHILLMMARAQTPTILMAGDMPMNLDTFVNVMKTVYKVAMLLAEMVD